MEYSRATAHAGFFNQSFTDKSYDNFFILRLFKIGEMQFSELNISLGYSY